MAGSAGAQSEGVRLECHRQSSVDLPCRSVGSYVGKIAAGVKPSGIPVAQSTVFGFVINLKTAKVPGITVPRDLLLSANSFIE